MKLMSNQVYSTGRRKESIARVWISNGTGNITINKKKIDDYFPDKALRIIIPPTTNQYLNLTKNSSLAAAIAYPDLVLVFAGTAMMQTGRAIEIVSITMLTYLTLSILISMFMNWYNKKIAIKEK